VRSFSLRVGTRFRVVLFALLAALVGIGLAGAQGLNRVRVAGEALYKPSLESRADQEITLALDAAEEVTLQIVASRKDDSTSLKRELVEQAIPGVDIAIGKLRITRGDDGRSAQLIDQIAASWTAFEDQALRETNASSRDEDVRDDVQHLIRSLAGARAAARELAELEARRAEEIHRGSVEAYRVSVVEIVGSAVVALLSGIAMIIWLIRSIVPRTREYSRFALRVAEGEIRETLDVQGADEIAEFGRALGEMVKRRNDEIAFQETQLEFASWMQATASEDEAHELLKRHLERSIPGSNVVILNRNNSADRLETVSALPPDSPLVHGLRDAEPRSCLAVRLSRVRRSVPGLKSLLECQVCGGYEDASTCMPLLVGGEVIGSVLIAHDALLSQQQGQCATESIAQAAPVLANLRTLAIAELRAATDALTGLPNKRAVQDTVKRMVAHAIRTSDPLAAISFDLDHFKEINDRFGHGHGDEVLAAIGSVVRATLRESDFAGRCGGEEFICLLPSTTAQGAAAVAEKLRAAVSEIFVTGVERRITISAGIAGLPEHARDAHSLERAADRALYVAKTSGRDRVAMAVAKEQERVTPPVVSPVSKPS